MGVRRSDPTEVPELPEASVDSTSHQSAARFHHFGSGTDAEGKPLASVETQWRVPSNVDHRGDEEKEEPLVGHLHNFPLET